MKSFLKGVALVGFIFLGAVVTTTIDNLIGIKFNDVSMIVQGTHKVTYMLWGATLTFMTKRLVGW